MLRRMTIATMACAALALGCPQQDDAPVDGASSPQQPQAQAARPEPSAAPVPGHEIGESANGINRNRGRVISATVAGGYAYLEMDVAGRRVWLATKPSQVQPGDEISWGDFAPMNNFTSKALGRTFDQILFVAEVVPLNVRAAASDEGRVVNVETAGGYSYIEVERQGGKLWLAAPVSTVAPGDRIRWDKGAPMRNFTSKSLDRSFDEIYFTGGVHLVE